MGLTKCPDCGGKVSDSAPACPHCGRPMKKPEEKSDPRISQTSSGGRIYCTDCKGYVNPNKQAGRKSNLYIKADLPGAYDPMVRMPDGRPEYYCPICNKRLYGEPASYGSSYDEKPSKGKQDAATAGCIIYLILICMAILGFIGSVADDPNPIAGWALLIGLCGPIFMWGFWPDEFEYEPESSQGKKAEEPKSARKKETDEKWEQWREERKKNKKSPAEAPDPASSAKDKLIVEEAVRKELRIKPKDEVTKETLAKVTRLYLVGTKITDVGLKEVVKLRGLKSLYLSKTQITNRGLKDLANMQQLEKLKLNGTQITDEGLKELVKLQNLQTLYLGRTQITNAAVAELKKALPPNCTIYWP